MINLRLILKSEIKWITVIVVFVMLDTISTLIAIESFGFEEHNFAVRFFIEQYSFPLNYNIAFFTMLIVDISVYFLITIIPYYLLSRFINSDKQKKLLRFVFRIMVILLIGYLGWIRNTIILVLGTDLPLIV